MTVTTTNLIQGPAELWLAVFGSAEPEDDEAIGSPFANLGGTQDGVTLTVDLTWSELTVDQVIDIPGQRLVKRAAKIATNLAEATLANLALALNNTAPVSDSLEFDNGTDAYKPKYQAIILEGPGPEGKTRRVVVRKVLQTGSPASSYKKDGQTLIPVEFVGHYVSNAIKSVRVYDLDDL